MVTQKIGRHEVEMYDAIDELPVVRFHRYQKMLLIDSGIGGDIAAFDQRAERARRFLLAGELEKAQAEFENLRQCVFFIQSGLNPKHRAFAALVTKIDGEPAGDASDAAIDAVLAKLADAPEGEVTARLEAVKKKIDTELRLYFPLIFEVPQVKEYYDILRSRSLALLGAIMAGKDDPAAEPEVDALTTALLTYSRPEKFDGAGGMEIRQDREFENLCLALSEQLHVKPKEYTVLEFYNAFDFLKERARKADNAKKRPK